MNADIACVVCGKHFVYELTGGRRRLLCSPECKAIRRARLLKECRRSRGRIPWQHKSAGYIMLRRPKHPLANSAGCVAEHRAVLYDLYGSGPQACYWCGTALTWATLHTDHLNDVRDDNRTSNLVISCGPCNTARGHTKALLRRMRPEAFEVFAETAKQTVFVREDERKTASC